MRVYVLYMHVYACICVVYAAKGGQQAGKGRKCPQPFKMMKMSNLNNKEVYSYNLLGGGKIFRNSSGCRKLYMAV